MRASLLIVLPLLLLPGLAHSVICKTVGADGVTSFTDVPAAECPQGSRTTDYARPAGQQLEQAGSVDTGVTARKMPFDGYRSIEIVSPEAGRSIRSNSGTIPVVIQLDPGLQQGHFVTVYLDGRATRGRFGSSKIELAGVDRGTHKLRAKVSDSRGKTLIESDVISFTVQKISPEITVHPITGDDYLDPGEARRRVEVTGTYTGANKENAKITLHFPVSGWTSGPVEVDENGSWKVRVPGSRLAGEASFDAVAEVSPDPTSPETVFEFKTTSTHSVDPQVFSGFHGTPRGNYAPAGPAVYTPQGGGVPTTPGQTNPAFNPRYAP